MADQNQDHKCPQCHGARCPYCLKTGQQLLHIGEHVVWENMDHWTATPEIKKKCQQYLGKVLRVNGLLPCAGDGDPDTPDYYYVGVQVEGGVYPGLIFSCNVRRATAAETKAASS